MHYLILSILVCVAAVSAAPAVFPGGPFRPNPYMPPVQPVFPPGMSTGGGYVDQGFARGTGGSRGSSFQRQGSNSYYNQGENHSRVKQVVERENSSSHSLGGSSQGSFAGQSGGNFGSYDNGYLKSGGGFAHSGYFV